MLKPILVLVGLIVLFAVIAALARRYGLLDSEGAARAKGRDGGDAAAETPYRRKKYLLSKAERSFFGVLRHVVADRYIICPMVRLGDVLQVEKGAAKRQGHQNRINLKHIDFLLCDPDAISPLLAIELDDSSHSRSDRRTRDAFVDSALAAAGLPLLRVRAQEAYSTSELRQQLDQSLGA